MTTASSLRPAPHTPLSTSRGQCRAALPSSPTSLVSHIWPSSWRLASSETRDSWDLRLMLLRQSNYISGTTHRLSITYSGKLTGSQVFGDHIFLFTSFRLVPCCLLHHGLPGLLGHLQARHDLQNLHADHLGHRDPRVLCRRRLHDHLPC